MKAICLVYREEKKRNTLWKDERDVVPQTISHDPATVEIGDEHENGHCHYDCPLCSEEALPERCPGFRLDWLC